MPKNVVAVILAGGDGRRLGGVNKALVTLGGRRLVDHVYAAIKDQVADCALSLRAPTPWSNDMGLPVLQDKPAPDRGPLGGVAAALRWAEEKTPSADWVLTVPVDVPFLPPNLAERLCALDADVVVAASDGQTHHAIAAWRPALADSLCSALAIGALAIHRYQSMVTIHVIDWPATDHDPFMNINTPDDLALAEHVLKD